MLERMRKWGRFMSVVVAVLAIAGCGSTGGTAHSAQHSASADRAPSIAATRRLRAACLKLQRTDQRYGITASILAADTGEAAKDDVDCKLIGVEVASRATPSAAASPQPSRTTPSTATSPGLTVSEQEAVSAGKQYLQTEAFSRD
jgi:hypothetical protein